MIHQNAQIHLDPIDIDPLPSESNLCREMCRGIEVIREDAIRRGVGSSTVCLTFDRGPVRLDSLEDVV